MAANECKCSKTKIILSYNQLHYSKSYHLYSYDQMPDAVLVALNMLTNLIQQHFEMGALRLLI